MYIISIYIEQHNKPGTRGRQGADGMRNTHEDGGYLVENVNGLLRGCAFVDDSFSGHGRLHSRRF
jgi:hypothetical protein